MEDLLNIQIDDDESKQNSVKRIQNTKVNVVSDLCFLDADGNLSDEQLIFAGHHYYFHGDYRQAVDTCTTLLERNSINHAGVLRDVAELCVLADAKLSSKATSRPAAASVIGASFSDRDTASLQFKCFQLAPFRPSAELISSVESLLLMNPFSGNVWLRLAVQFDCIMNKFVDSCSCSEQLRAAPCRKSLLLCLRCSLCCGLPAKVLISLGRATTLFECYARRSFCDHWITHKLAQISALADRHGFAESAVRLVGRLIRWPKDNADEGDLAAPAQFVQPNRQFHLSFGLCRKMRNMKSSSHWPGKPVNFLKFNDVVYPPADIDSMPRPAEICHVKSNIKYSWKKMWYLAVMVRGLSIDEALKQMTFHKAKGALHVKQALLDAQEMAVKDFNVEFRSNLWIESSFVTRGAYIRGIRRCAYGRIGVVNYGYCHYFVRLREGAPPDHYYAPEKTGWQKIEEYLDDWRKKRIISSL